MKTQKEFAARLGVHFSLVSHVLKGRRNFSVDKAEIAGALTGSSPLIWMKTGQERQRQQAFSAAV
jgi:Plasmid maintenance system antidote protein